MLTYPATILDAFCSHVDLRHNTHLRSLRVIHIIHCTSPGTFVLHLRKLPHLLRTIVSPVISEMTFLMYVDKVAHLQDFAWAALDESLSAPNLASLTKITFCIRGEMREDHLAVEAAIRLQMPLCCAMHNMIFLDCW